MVVGDWEVRQQSANSSHLILDQTCNCRGVCRKIDALQTLRQTTMETLEIYDAAVFRDFEAVASLLSKNPAAVNVRDEYGFTPLHGVAGEDQFEMAEYLIAHGAEVQATNDSGVTPLHLAAYPEMVKLLVKHGADLEARENGGGTPLHLASENPEALDVMRELLQLGADANAKDSSGGTALETAMARAEQEKVELLLAFGAAHASA